VVSLTSLEPWRYQCGEKWRCAKKNNSYREVRKEVLRCRENLPIATVT